MARILVVDDEDDVRMALQRRVRRDNHEVDTANGVVDAMRAITGSPAGYEVVVTDMSMEAVDSGLTVLTCAHQRDTFCEVIVLTAYGSVSNAVEAMRRGAFDYIEKNVPGVDVYDVLAMKIHDALARRAVAIDTLRRLAGRGGGGTV